MNRRTFLSYSGLGFLILSGVTVVQLLNQNNYRYESIPDNKEGILDDDFFYIIYLASLAPSGHNTQPWTIRMINRNHWVLGTEKSRWLPAVDPENREVLLSLGAFLENLIIAAGIKGYDVETEIRANHPLDSEIVDIKLYKTHKTTNFNEEKIILRRTIRNNFLNDSLSVEDLKEIISDDQDSFTYYPQESQGGKYLKEGTILANRIQAYRNSAQEELAKWIRWSKDDVRRYMNGLTPETMEIQGIARLYVENFYSNKSVMDNSFREDTIRTVQRQVNGGSGWLLLESKDSSILELIATGRKLQRMWLKVRGKMIAIHPMTQMLEEEPLLQQIVSELNSNKKIQFLLRVGYVKDYPRPVSPRMLLSRIMI
ncbi:Acg family FMN-binding oxidoreductase [Pelosinus sp. sgz500959]|uniref:Acg family FMN-binding oxidoreductase n=1 Tax=Pelosinus sp. sgz500959 TaxID=3242472 RepID=UPI00366D1893